jgi:hypothetical protein
MACRAAQYTRLHALSLRQAEQLGRGAAPRRASHAAVAVAVRLQHVRVQRKIVEQVKRARAPRRGSLGQCGIKQRRSELGSVLL